MYLEETAGRETTGKDVNDLRQRFDKYISMMQEMMFQEVNLEGSKVLREEAFVSVCDLLLFFSPHAIKAKGGDDGRTYTDTIRIRLWFFELPMNFEMLLSAILKKFFII